MAEYDAGAGLTIVDEVKDQPRLASGRRHHRAPRHRRHGARDGRARPQRVVCELRGVRRIAAVATSAVREAFTGEDSVQRVRDEPCIPLRIIDAETEAALSWRSVAHHFRMDGARTIVADIGGGSLELIGAVDGLVESTCLAAARRRRGSPRPMSAAARTFGEEVGVAAKACAEGAAEGFPWREWTNPVFVGSGRHVHQPGTHVDRASRAAGATAFRHRCPHGEAEKPLEWL